MAHNGTNLYPIAVILRLTESARSETGDVLQNRTISRLVVARIGNDSICVVGSVPPGAQQIEQARRMADRAFYMSCETGN